MYVLTYDRFKKPSSTASLPSGFAKLVKKIYQKLLIDYNWKDRNGTHSFANAVSEHLREASVLKADLP